MIKSKNQKIVAAFIAGVSFCSNVANASETDYRGPNSGYYGGGGTGYTGTVTGNPGSGEGGSSSGSTSGSSSSGTTSGSGSSSSSGTTSGGSGSSSGSSGSSSGSTSGSSGSSSSGTGSSSTGTSGETSGGSTSGTGSGSGGTNPGSNQQPTNPGPNIENTISTAKENASKTSESINKTKESFFTRAKNFVVGGFEKIGEIIIKVATVIDAGVKSIVEKIMPKKTVGDPVAITAGKFYTNDVDYSVKYGNSIFDITRSYSSQEFPNGAFGKNWTSVFDERIIRGTGVDYLNDLKTSLANYEKDFESYYNSVKPYVSNPYTIPEIIELKNNVDSLKAMVSKMESSANVNPGLNIYTVHGYENIVNKMDSSSLIFIDSSGAPFNFIYNGSTQKYDCISATGENRISIEENNGKMIVTYIDGTKKYFDKWGMLEKIEDKFGSSIKYEYYENIENNVRRVRTVLSNDVPVLSIEWSNNRISKITDARKNLSVKYGYDEKDCLVSFIDSDGDEYGFVYDESMDLTKMVKPDQSFIKIDYALNSSGEKKVTAVTNEEGYAEHFSYNDIAGKTTYTDADGNVYTYCYEGDQIVDFDDPSGYTVNRTYDSRGLVETKNDPFGKVSYTYDSYQNLVGAKYSDGSSESWFYTQPNNLLETYVNRDGVKTELKYSQNGGLEKIYRDGNLIQTYIRDNSGRIIEAKGTNRNEKYSYNNDGLVVSDSRGNYEYDEMDRVVSYKTFDGYTWEFAYSDDNKIQTAILPGNLFEKNEYNNRKDLTKKIQKDLITGETRIYIYEYDARHNPISVKTGFGSNDEIAEKNIHLVKSIEYYPSGKIYSEIEWNNGDSVDLDGAGLKTVYTYKLDNISSIFKTYVDKNGIEIGQPFKKDFEVKYSDGKKLITRSDEGGNKTVGKFNSFGQMVGFTDETGRSTLSNFTSGGVLKSDVTVQGGKISYTWDESFDNTKSIADSYSKIVEYIYDDCGRIKTETFINGEKNNYEYTEENGLTTVVQKSQSKTVESKYDSNGLETFVKITEPSGKTVYEKYVSLDKKNNTISQTVGKIETSNKLNAWGDVTENFSTGTKYAYDENSNCILIENGNTKVELSYNVFGKISSMKTGDRFEKYCYDANGNLLKTIDNLGTVTEFTYDTNGNLICEKGRVTPEKKYEYDAAGNLIKTFESGDLIESIEYSADMKTKKITDAKGNTRINKYDSYGNLLSVTDRLGKTRYVENQREKNSVNFVDYNGRKSSVSKSILGNSVVTKFEDGTSDKIYLDSLGSISKMENQFGMQKYSFDTAHNLISVLDGTQKINYSYDAKGRVKSLSTDNHKTTYDYFENGYLKSIAEDNFKRTFAYDDFGQRISATDNSGAQVCYEYDEIGRPVLTYQKDKSGNIVYVEGIVYGNDGRVSCTFDKDGKFTSYEYDDHGRVTKVLLPFIQTILEDAKLELAECGKKSYDSIILEIANVDSSDKNSAGKLLSKIGLSTANIYELQEVWAETYTYDANGNRITKTNPAGKLEYEYDAENRLVKIAGPNPVKISYDSNGNMVSKKTNLVSQQWKYSQNNRMLESTYSDFEKDLYIKNEYGYDSIGRQTFVKNANGKKVFNLYDGFTFDKIYQWQDKNNAYASQFGSENNSKIRFRDIDGFTNAERTYRDSPSENYCTFDRYYLHANGELVAQFNENYSYSKERLVKDDVFAFCNDNRGSVRSVMGGTGDFAYGVSYGLNGQPYFNVKDSTKPTLSNVVNSNIAASFGADIGFAGKSYDSLNKTYNYGLRDYAPSLARFVTEDPIHDGENWYNYCKGDPINHVDYIGLKIIPADMKGTMQSGRGLLLGNSRNVYIEQQGCYLTTLSGVYNTLNGLEGDERVDPMYINKEKSNFPPKSQCMDTYAYCKNYDFQFEEFVNNVTYDQVADRIDEYANADENYCLAVKMDIEYGSENKHSVHWVTTDGGVKKIDGKKYVKAIGSSNYDVSGNSRHGWIDVDGEYYAPIDQLTGVRAFTTEEFKNKQFEKKKNK